MRTEKEQAIHDGDQLDADLLRHLRCPWCGEEDEYWMDYGALGVDGGTTAIECDSCGCLYNAEASYFVKFRTWRAP